MVKVRRVNQHYITHFCCGPYTMTVDTRSVKDMATVLKIRRFKRYANRQMRGRGIHELPKVR